MGYLEMVNSWPIYLICGSIVAFIFVMCIVMLRKSYRLGVSLNMDQSVLKRIIVSTSTFTFLPALSVLIGLFALSGTLGVPMAWLRLSVIGALQYELQVTDISLQALGYHGIEDIAKMSASDFGTIALVMAVGIIGGLIASIFFLKRYLKKVQGRPEQTKQSSGFSAYATIAMFIGLCSAYFGAFVGDIVVNRESQALIVAIISGLTMCLFEGLRKWKKWEWIDGFSIAVSMMVGMASAVFMSL